MGGDRLGPARVLDLASASQCGQAMSMARRHDVVRVAVRDAPCGQARARNYLGSRLWYLDIDPDKMTGRARAGARSALVDQGIKLERRTRAGELRPASSCRVVDFILSSVLSSSSLHIALHIALQI